MDDPQSRLWEEMLAEFRALGGTAENICLKQGPYGRGLFPIDPSKPIEVHIPDSLLLDMQHVDFDSEGAFRVSPEAPMGARERAFLEKYERDFSWGVGRAHTKELLQMLAEAPAEIKEVLQGTAWLAGPTEEAIRERFFFSRIIRYSGRQVVMPIVELANYGPGTEYDDTNGVGLKGQFPGEILVMYEILDPLEVFRNWGFAAATAPFALSMQMRLECGPGVIFVGRNTEFTPGDKPYFPDVSVENGRIVLSNLLLGHKNFPGLARGNFYRIMRDARWPGAEEAFDRIQHFNRMALYRVLESSERAAPALGRILRDLVRAQLDAMSFCFGVRDV